MRPGFITPFGGPASGLWPSGSGGPPTPPKAQCLVATICSDCFASCVGTIDDAFRGPICGWIFDEMFGNLGGSVSFIPGYMTFNAPTQQELPAASKAISLTSFLNITGQFTFSEFPGTSGAALAVYTLQIYDVVNGVVVLVALFDDGTIDFELGPTPGPRSVYSGVWTPNGGTHKVHFTSDALGTPRLWIDGVEIPLVFFVFDATPPTTIPNTIDFNMLNFDGPGPAKSSTVRNVFVTTGVLSPDTVFCCPP